MRASGILLPIFSLSSKYGIGCFSKEAYQFVDFLVDSGQKYWQILPLGPTSYGDSPYQSFSVFAGNPYFISLEYLIEEGLLTEQECEEIDFGNSQDSIDYEKLYKGRYKLLKKAYQRSEISNKLEFINFQKQNEYWLRDYAMFMAIKDRFDGKSFDLWEKDIRNRTDFALEQYRKELYYNVEFYEYLQYEFFKQWFKLKEYANRKGISIIGDIPIYVAYDSADVWSKPHLFQLDVDKKPTAVAGCPPDGFSKNGQLWGNPLYDWKKHKEIKYDWWIKRMEKCKELYDVIRIDHFRGFDQYYSIPSGHNTAVNGQWKNGPGMDLFLEIKNSLGDTNIIAEDLGYITDSVRQLVKDSGFPNMKVLEFAFDSRDSSGPSEYLPYAYDKNCVVYTGTHDNETLYGWLKNIGIEELKMIKEYLGKDIDDKNKLVDELIRLAQASVADICIIPLQDYLHLDNNARINTPSTLGTNWKWRVDDKYITQELTEYIYKYTLLYGRS